MCNITSDCTDLYLFFLSLSLSLSYISVTCPICNIFLTSFFGRLGFGWLLKQNECSLFRALNERNGFASLSFGYQNQMASTADSLLFLAASPHASWHDHGVGSEFIETFVLTGGNTVSHPAFLSGEEKWPTTLESAVVMDTMESSAGLLGPTVRGTPRSSQVWGQSFRSEFPPTSRAPEMDELCRKRGERASKEDVTEEISCNKVGWALALRLGPLLLFTVDTLSTPFLNTWDPQCYIGNWVCLFACRRKRGYGTVYIRCNLSPSPSSLGQASAEFSSILSCKRTHTPHIPPPKLGTSLPLRAAITS